MAKLVCWDSRIAAFVTISVSSTSIAFLASPRAVELTVINDELYSPSHTVRVKANLEFAKKNDAYTARMCRLNGAESESMLKCCDVKKGGGVKC